MEKITYLVDSDGNEHVIINHGNGEYTSMTKEHYDKLQEELNAK